MTASAKETSVEDDMRERMGKMGTKDPGHVPPLLRKASPERLHLNFAGHVWRQWSFNVPAGTEPELILAPAYWVPVHQLLLPHDKIRAIDEAGAWEGELVMRTVDPMAVTVGRIYIVAFEIVAGVRGGPSVANRLGGTVLYRGLQRQWSAEMQGNTLRDGFETYAAGWQWLNQHLRTMEAAQ